MDNNETFDKFRACAVEVLQVPAEKVVPDARFGEDLDAVCDFISRIQVGIDYIWPFIFPHADQQTVVVDARCQNQYVRGTELVFHVSKKAVYALGGSHVAGEGM